MHRTFRLVVVAALLALAVLIPQTARAAEAANVTAADLLATPTDADISDGDAFLRYDLGYCEGFISIGKAKVAGQYEVHWSAYVYCPEALRTIAVASYATPITLTHASGAWVGVPGVGAGYTYSWGEFFLPVSEDCFRITAKGQMGAGESKTWTATVCSAGIYY